MKGGIFIVKVKSLYFEGWYIYCEGEKLSYECTEAALLNRNRKVEEWSAVKWSHHICSLYILLECVKFGVSDLDVLKEAVLCLCGFSFPCILMDPLLGVSSDSDIPIYNRNYPFTKEQRSASKMLIYLLFSFGFYKVR